MTQCTAGDSLVCPFKCAISQSSYCHTVNGPTQQRQISLRGTNPRSVLAEDNSRLKSLVACSCVGIQCDQWRDFVTAVQALGVLVEASDNMLSSLSIALTYRRSGKTLQTSETSMPLLSSLSMITQVTIISSWSLGSLN